MWILIVIHSHNTFVCYDYLDLDEYLYDNVSSYNKMLIKTILTFTQTSGFQILLWDRQVPLQLSLSVTPKVSLKDVFLVNIWEFLP